MAGRHGEVPLRMQSVATFYAATLAPLALAAPAAMDVRVELRCTPCEIAEAVPFADDDVVRRYGGESFPNAWFEGTRLLCFKAFSGPFREPRR